MFEIKILSLFSGIGAFEKALTRQGIIYEVVGFSEIDKWAIESYSAIHGVSKELNLGDIADITVDDMPNCDLVTYGFPCQDISVAGLGKGIVKGETRSGLLYEALRVIKNKLPSYAIAENVKNLVGKKHKEEFEGLLQELESYGYNNYWQVLNAKDYGIPQNRERVFIVSIRKDIDNGEFEFPQGLDSGLRLKDFLQDEVEDKYYIDNEKVDSLISQLKDKGLLNGDIFGADGTIMKPKKRDISNCIIARIDAGIRNRQGMGMVVAEPTRIKKVGNIYPSGGQNGDIYTTEGLSPTLRSGQGTKPNTGIGSNNSPKLIVKEPIVVASRGRNPKDTSDRTTGSPTEQRLEPNTKGVTNTLTTVQKDNYVLEPIRLGGLFDKEDGRKHQAGSVWDKGGLAPTIDTCQGGYREPSIIVKEPNTKRVTNTLTTVQKDNLILEPKVLNPNDLIFVGGINNKDWAGDGKKLSRNYPQGNRVYDINGISCSQTAQGGGLGSYTGLYLNPNELHLHTNLSGGKWDKVKESLKRVYDEKGIAPTIDTCQGGHREPKVAIKEATANSKTRRGRVGKQVAQTLETSCNQATLEATKPRKDIKDADICCKHCNKQLERNRYDGRLEDFTAFKNRKCCDRICMRKDCLKIGEHGQSYSNAHTTARKINELILKKDECENCGSVDSLDIHHLDENWKNNNLENLSCLCRSCHMKLHKNKDVTSYRIRKLTPLEVWRLMGFDDADYWKARKALEDEFYNGGDKSNSQMYKMAGNSIVVNVLEYIIKGLF